MINEVPRMRLDIICFDIKQHLKFNNITQRQFAKRAFLSNSTISRLLIGNTNNLDSNSLVKIAHALGKNPVFYMGLDPSLGTSIQGRTTLEKLKCIILSDTNLNDNQAKSLYNLMEVSYNQFVK